MRLYCTQKDGYIALNGERFDVVDHIAEVPNEVGERFIRCHSEDFRIYEDKTKGKVTKDATNNSNESTRN